MKKQQQQANEKSNANSETVTTLIFVYSHSGYLKW